MIKLISDFDGVWTNQEEESNYVWEFIVSELGRITKKNTDEVKNILNGVRHEMDKNPHLYGWRYDGEIATFYAEDPFGDNSAVFDYIEQQVRNPKKEFNARTQRYREIGDEVRKIREQILKAGFESLDMFPNYCFLEATKKFKEEGRLMPADNAKDTIHKLLGADVELVVASNSSTHKIDYLFSRMGFGHEIRARGNSMKFRIEKGYEALPYYMEVSADYKIPLRRKTYHGVLLEEKPDYVAGDVFSLDIALPLYLSVNDGAFRGMKLILKVQKHTPSWVKNFLGKIEFKEIVYLIDDIKELPRIVAG